jgi:small subunit ribosomal protein S9
MSSTKVVYWGTGRRKTAVARVRVVPGNGTVTINGRPGDNYLNYNPVYLAAVKAPLQTLGLSSEYDLLVNVRGGGLTGQADAIKQGAARALCELSPENRKPLKTEGHLSRDPRAKERRKHLHLSPVFVMPKADIHPTWYPDAKVICNGEVVMTTGSTSPEIHVDVWSGNHPFYTGTQKILDTEGRVDRFMRKYGMGSAAGDAAAEPKAEAAAKA